jgi:hypothetical protein
LAARKGVEGVKRIIGQCLCPGFCRSVKHGYDHAGKYKMSWFHFAGRAALSRSDQFTGGQLLGDYGRCSPTLGDLLVGRVYAWQGYTTEPKPSFNFTKEAAWADGFAEATGVVFAARLPQATLAQKPALAFHWLGLGGHCGEVRAWDRLGAALPVEVSRHGVHLAGTARLRSAGAESGRFAARGLTVFVRVLLHIAPPGTRGPGRRKG